jgi:tetratricopeptide (TPR) repeat protein
LLLGLFAVQHPAIAETPALYGQEYYRLGQSWEDGSPRSLLRSFPRGLLRSLPRGLPPPRPDNGNGDESAYLQQLQLQELSAGPYSDSLAEPLSSLGHYYRERGEYAEALGFYRRALHVVRVNDGLYSERQIPLVRDLLDTYRLAGDLQELDERYEYFFRLYGKGEPPYTDLRLRASLEFLRWQREAIRIELDGDGRKRLLDMYQLNEHILETAALATQVTPEWYGKLVLSQIRNLYLLQAEIELPDEEFTNRSSSSIQSGQGYGLDFHVQRLEGIRRTSAARGRSLLEELIVRMEKSGVGAGIAGIQLELGDWHQWNGNPRSARLAYRKVIELLEDSGDMQLLEQWLGSPVELPANGAFWQTDSLETESRRVVLAAQFDVSARGRARNIQASASKPEDEAFASRLRRKLSATRFRPRFVSGEPEAVERISRQYELIVD